MDWTNSYVGLPYKLRGRDREGLDCWGLVRLVLLEQKEILVPLHDTVDSTNPIAIADAVDVERASGDWIPVISPETRREFDFLVMRTAIRERERMVSADIHIGIAAPRGFVLHVQEDDSAVLQPFRALHHRIVGIYRHKELT